MIFDKFYRGKRGAGVRKGSGMGLAISRAIVQAHGGSIEVSSDPGSGARFRFWVPLVSEEPQTTRPLAPTENKQATDEADCNAASST
jgi:signal transduction histidine kinase